MFQWLMVLGATIPREKGNRKGLVFLKRELDFTYFVLQGLGQQQKEVSSLGLKLISIKIECFR
jgi:hypothetical protein